jgi:hypothetical protein
LFCSLLGFKDNEGKQCVFGVLFGLCARTNVLILGFLFSLEMILSGLSRKQRVVLFVVLFLRKLGVAEGLEKF